MNRKIRLYIPNVILTVLLVFSLIGTEMTLLAQRVALNSDAFRLVAEQQDLEDKAYTTLETYFKTKENSTGIPAEVFLNTLDRQELKNGILGSVNSAFDYLSGKTDAYSFTMPFTDLETAVTAFFNDYADENGYAKDAAFDAKVSAAIEDAENEILFVCDTYKLSVAEKNGWLKTARKAVSYLNLATALCIAAAAVLLVLLIVCNLKQPEHLCYWGGLAAFTAGLLVLVPCIYLTATDYFARFAIKDPQIFAAVVGYLRLLTSRAMSMAIVTLVIGVIAFAAFAFLRALQREEAEEAGQ